MPLVRSMRELSRASLLGGNTSNQLGCISERQGEKSKVHPSRGIWGSETNGKDLGSGDLEQQNDEEKGPPDYQIPISAT